jgi:hypothetical protein
MQGQQVSTCSGSRDACALRRQGGVQSLAFCVKTLQHSHAFDHPLNHIRFGYRHTPSSLRDYRTINPIIAQS